MTPERVRWWHGAIFARHFPYDGGHFRQERAYFGVTTAGGGMRQIEGSSPDTLRRDLADVCVSFNGGVEQLGKQNASLLERTRVAGALYASILRVHPLPTGTTARASSRSRRHCGHWDYLPSNSCEMTT
jgi:Ni,Fe-hydrogenase III large subunit